MKRYSFFLLLLIFACNDNTSSTKNAEEEVAEIQPESQIEERSEVEQVLELKKQLNTTFKDYKVEAKAEDGRFKINATNPKGNIIETADIILEGDLKFVEIFDMNEDGRPEIYVVETTATGEKLHACSLTPFSALPINIPMMKLAKFKGDDAYQVEEGQLMRTYTTTENKQAKIAYNLVAGEAGFRFEPHGVRADEMQSKVFGTYVTEGYPDSYWKKLAISDNGLGEIVINITASEIQDGRPDCSFESVGQLVEGKIIAPLNFRKESSKGSMLLMQIENGWVVLTTNPNDGEELKQFCKSGKSLAGKYLSVDTE